MYNETPIAQRKVRGRSGYFEGAVIIKLKCEHVILNSF